MDLDQRIKDKMMKNNIRPSMPRTRIYKYLLEHRNHPTVDTIYKALQSELFSLSKTTVYNTLALFTDKGLVRAIGIEDKELRYDADLHTHGHFKCVKCHAIFDFELDLDTINLQGLSQFIAEDYHLNVKGVCRNCQEV
ncbi:Fur family transcriptional regulator [Ancylomarina longa]|uniref:Ferric uptake regulation protein n=1 Tax=Ancylomarina longa TaxID=2487017 RepID=A0A434AF63_9BACT|nr:Fur family transcriptional regulator [Ancylomarina longa]RUT73014.1 transcriptional repressor [Ancylomarina longa]